MNTPTPRTPPRHTHIARVFDALGVGGVVVVDDAMRGEGGFTGITQAWGKAVSRCHDHRRVTRQRSPYGRTIRLAAAFMPATARQRWLENIAESLHDFEPDQHRAILRDFLRSAPVVIFWSWTVNLPGRVLSGLRPSERHDDRPIR
jgi:hypothetical protein